MGTTEVDAAIRDLQRLHEWVERQREHLQDLKELSNVADSVIGSLTWKQDLHERARPVK